MAVVPAFPLQGVSRASASAARRGSKPRPREAALQHQIAENLAPASRRPQGPRGPP
jgi:hypothetical protein